MTEYRYLILATLLSAAIAITVYFARRGRSDLPAAKRTWLDYVLLWPLILPRGGRLFTKREWAGWGAVLALIVSAIIFTR